MAGPFAQQPDYQATASQARRHQPSPVLVCVSLRQRISLLLLTGLFTHKSLRDDDIWTAFTRGRIIGKLEGRPQCDKCGCRSSELLTASFHDFGDNFKLQEQLSGGSSSGRPTRNHTRRRLVHCLTRPEETGGRRREKSLGHTTQVTGRPIYSAFYLWPEDCTVRGLLGTTPCTVCIFNARPSEKADSLWCREHRNWRDNEWGRVLFTDESRFSLSGDSHRILHLERAGKPQSVPRTSLKGNRYGGQRCSSPGRHHAW
ncbi:hypothetical protein TNCV_4904521 [Trichonephila clavipes]|nr:hypothetical protein TNCV_4904521 [Trichonephila clavipes]